MYSGYPSVGQVITLVVLYQQVTHVCVSFMMSYPAMSLGDRLCESRRSGQGEVGGCTQKVQTAWPCLDLSAKKLLVGAG